MIQTYTTHIYSNIFRGYFKVSHGHEIKFYMNEIAFLMKLYYFVPKHSTVSITLT